MKDLNRILRSIKKTIIVDNTASNFILHTGNGIFIKTWENNPMDIAPKKLSYFLRHLSEEA